MITGRETIEVEITEVNLPKVDLNLYQISSAEKFTPDVPVKNIKDGYIDDFVGWDFGGKDNFNNQRSKQA